MKRIVIVAALLITGFSPAMAQQMIGPAFSPSRETLELWAEHAAETQAGWELQQAWRCGTDPFTPHECAERIEAERLKDMWARAVAASDAYKATHAWARK